jgi:hypothetical protein
VIVNATCAPAAGSEVKFAVTVGAGGSVGSASKWHGADHGESGLPSVAPLVACTSQVTSVPSARALVNDAGIVALDCWPDAVAVPWVVAVVHDEPEPVPFW